MYKGISDLPLDTGTILLVFDVASSESTKTTQPYLIMENLLTI